VAVSGSSLAFVALALLQGRGTAPKPATRTEPPVYPFLIEPIDCLWGHLSEGLFREPIGVFYEPEARELFVADSKNARIGIFDEHFTPIFSFGGPTIFVEPKMVSVDRDGTIYVLDSARSDVRSFNYRGEPLEVLAFARPTEADAPASAVVVGAFTRDREGRWYLVDRELGRVFVYSKEREFLREVPPPAGAERYAAPVDVAVSAQGLVAVCDQRGDPALHVFDDQQKLVGAFGGRDIGLSDFTSPSGVAFDEFENLFAVDLLRHDVKVFTPAGGFLAHFGGWFTPETRGRAAGELLYPTDVEIVPGGPIFVAERFGQRVQIFERKPRPTR
jgi:DNA-binding beta-propeller fold protein YncE